MRGYVLIQQGIYIIFGKTGKCYVGQSIDLQRRITQHKYDLRKGKHNNKHLQRSYDKYGEDFFHYEIVELVEHRADLYLREQHYIDEYDSFRNGYNMSMAKATPESSAVSKGSRPEVSEKIRQAWSCPLKRAKQSATHKERLKDPVIRAHRSEISSTPEALETFKTRMRNWRDTLTEEESSELARKSARGRTDEVNALALLKSKVAKAQRWLDNKLPKHNKMGFKNIAFCKYKYKTTVYLFVLCSFMTTWGVRMSKKFSVDNMGLIPATAAACIWRDEIMTPMYIQFIEDNKGVYELPNT